MFSKLKRWVRKIRGFKPCPLCGERSVHWVQDCVLFEDEPPMFCHWECVACGARTETRPSRLTVDVARSLKAKGKLDPEFDALAMGEGE